MMSLMRHVLALVLSSGVLVVATGAWAVPAPAPDTLRVAKAVAKLTTVRGVVRSVSDTTLAIETDADGSRIEMRFAFDDKTVVMKQRKRIGVGEIAAGDPVTVRYAEQASGAVATRIWVRKHAETP